jgi:hypothetical protein
MKTYARIARRRLEAALRLQTGTRHRVTPVIDDLIELPAEIVDLATGPYQARFPDLAAKRKRKK